MSERDGYQHGVPCWVDTWQPDADAAATFYAGVFGWDVPSGSPGATSTRYDICQLDGRDVAAIGSPSPEGVGAAWTTYVWVDDADAAAAKAAQAGGSVVVAPFGSLDGGRMAIVADPTGAVIGLWQPGTHRGAQRVNEASAYAMSMLHTPDPEGAAAFYGDLFGWTTESFGEATMFRLPGFVGGEPEQPVSREVVAVMTPARDGEPARWDVDFWIADADAAAARAAELGGALVAGPYDTPIQRQAVLADPTGATFTVSALKAGG
jgi:predicted enzyme related to lactoylglutathione lyase